MTGPGEGKIPIKAAVALSYMSRRKYFDCKVYLHVKGYSLARVTHVDVESPILNEILKPRESLYVPFKVVDNEVIVYFRKVFYVKSLKAFANSLIIENEDLAKMLREGPFKTYVGGKVGGIFLGFHKEVIRRLEDFASKLGVTPL